MNYNTPQIRLAALSLSKQISAEIFGLNIRIKNLREIGGNDMVESGLLPEFHALVALRSNLYIQRSELLDMVEGGAAIDMETSSEMIEGKFN